MIANLLKLCEPYSDIFVYLKGIQRASIDILFCPTFRLAQEI